MQLAIDTSTDRASIAIVQDNDVLAEFTWRCGQNHTRQLLPNLEHLLRQFELNPVEITGIIVARGPGSFNGLRVGISVAKGLAFSLGIPIIGVSSLEAEAYQHAETGLPVCPIFNAGRGEIATAIIQVKTGAELTNKEIEAFCQTLPRYKRPRRIIFDDVPRNPTGKIEKPKLRKKYAGISESFKV